MKQFLKYRILLPINTFFCSSFIITNLILKIKYKKLIDKCYITNVAQGFRNQKQELIQTITQLYYNTPYSKRLFVRDYIIASFQLAKTSYKMMKSQDRNAKCNCGSGKKFKQCCRLKY